MLSIDTLTSYWTGHALTTNAIVFLNLLGALLLGLMVGYERSYHGRAAGMRTYGLVCMASAALTVISGYPNFWYGGHDTMMLVGPDPTRVIQGIMTGIGFLGAGVIMRDGFTISGLTTAASIWSAAAIGVMVGVGFYAAAILLAALSAVCMVWVSKLESWLPSRHAVAITLQFKKDYVPKEESLRRAAIERGYEIAGGSISVHYREGKTEWSFVAVVQGRKKESRITELAAELTQFDGVENFNLAHARN